MRRFGSEQGQALILAALVLPVLLAFMALVVDVGQAYGEKRKIQNAADAAALAAIQDAGVALTSCTDDTCREGYRDDVVATAVQYSLENGGTEILDWCADRDPDPSSPTHGHPIPGAPEDNNCYTWPFKGDWGKVEVKLKNSIDGFFTEFLGLGEKFFKPAARAVGIVAAEAHCYFGDPPVQRDDLLPDCELPGDGQTGVPYSSDSHCFVDGVQRDDLLPDCEIPPIDPQYGSPRFGEDAHCLFEPPVENPDQWLPDCRVPPSGIGGGSGEQAFLMTRACDAIYYTGAGGGRIGAFGTNGGLTFEGNADKRVDLLSFDRERCGRLLPQPPNGDPAACDATPTKNPGAAPCVRNLVDLSGHVPLNWPVPPPPLPIPLAPGDTWDPSTDYPSRCVLLSPPPGETTVTLTAAPGPPGIYCVSGSDTTLLITTSMTAGDGYTFFALNGARIHVASNGTSVRFYWPSECGPRPTTRDFGFDCFGRTINGYDPLTVLYSTNATPFVAGTTTCETSAICLNGQGGSLDGDVFAPLPRSFPPSLGPPPQGGGTVWIAGGAASAGAGFIETWHLVIQGNGASYTGTGPGGGSIDPGQQGVLDPGTGASCEFFPPVDNPNQYLPDCVVPGAGGQVGEIVLGSDPTCIFSPPVPNPEQYLPDCVIPAGEPVQGDVVTTGSDLGLDE